MIPMCDYVYGERDLLFGLPMMEILYFPDYGKVMFPWFHLAYPLSLLQLRSSQGNWRNFRNGSLYKTLAIFSLVTAKVCEKAQSFKMLHLKQTDFNSNTRSQYINARRELQCLKA